MIGLWTWLWELVARLLFRREASHPPIADALVKHERRKGERAVEAAEAVHVIDTKLEGRLNRPLTNEDIDAMDDELARLEAFE